ncbi:4-hydroxy-2-oxoglutarate aldolase, mitochondrial [Nymphon striatum]|nr:4-hydroxy-2-oxoglutarate aldolase, mitochondrial [Nymphon striatum]
MSLFKDGLMRKPTKAVLRNALLTEKADVDPNALHVLDGGALLHKVRWSTSVTYREVCDLYVNHIKSKYGIGTIVFDGYMDGPFTKDHEHARRSLNKRRCADVQCDLSTKVNLKQDVFLSSITNKSRLIDMLSTYLIKSGNKVIKCDEDADTEIVRCALYVAETGRKVNVVADDTDVALLLLYHWSESMEEITFTSERSKATFNITSSLLKIPAQIKSYLLVLHAWTGCDTTSAIHSKGKNSLLRKLKTSQHLRSLMDILSDKNADQVEVGAAGIELFLYMYGGNQTLTKLRYYKFMDMAAKGAILPENLPPTERAAVQHSCVGGVLALANCLGKQICDLENLIKIGDFEGARLLQCRLIRPNYAVTKVFGVPGVKKSMEWFGLHGGNTRSPLLPLDESEVNKLKSIFSSEGFL